MAKIYYLPLNCKDWLCSRTVLKMSGDAAKAFMYLLCEAWISKPMGYLPDDDRELADLAKVPYDKWIEPREHRGTMVSIRDEIVRVFVQKKCTENDKEIDVIFNERLMEDVHKSQAKQRLGNKNAKRTQTKRKRNARLNYNSNYNSSSSEKRKEPEKGEEIRSPKPDVMPTVRSVIELLNQEAGTSYRPNTKQTVSAISARLNESWTVDEFRMVIIHKVAEWADGEMSKYLRPETLFGPKFESYVQQARLAVKPKKHATASTWREFEDD